MDPVTLYGFQRSTYVNVVRLVLHAKGVPFLLHDTESEMHEAAHSRRHPFGRVPVLQHGGFWLYETSAIALYVDEAFPGPRLQPVEVHKRAKMHQWISSLNAYFYPYVIYYLVHERMVFPELGIAADETIVAAAMPRIEQALSVMEDQLKGTQRFLADDSPTLADFFLLPTLTALGLTTEGKELLERFPRIDAWRTAMGALDPVKAFRLSLPPRLPIEHARRWATEHRPGVL
jgi:glutathione S-transferase